MINLSNLSFYSIFFLYFDYLISSLFIHDLICFMLFHYFNKPVTFLVLFCLHFYLYFDALYSFLPLSRDCLIQLSIAGFAYELFSSCPLLGFSHLFLIICVFFIPTSFFFLFNSFSTFLLLVFYGFLVFSFSLICHLCSLFLRLTSVLLFHCSSLSFIILLFLRAHF